MMDKNKMAEIQDGGLDIPYRFVCPLYIYNTKKACFVRIKGSPYAPHMFGHPPYVWMPPNVWMHYHYL